MEHLRSTTFSESLKDTLHCYQLTSIDSLSGPSGYPALAAQMWFKENKQLPPVPPQPMVQIPYFIPNDKSAKRSDTSLAGEKIACFIVGGEKRLCLPQILTSVLREYSIAEINQACAELHIYCSRCLPDQLEILKVLGILPINTAQCGLITKTDAERLVALLTDQHEPVKKDRLPKDIDADSGISVYHECFGRAYGKLYPNAYVSPAAKCIKCEDCRCMYSPQRFITHSDRSFEKRTCHWGFDPENWRNYLLLPLDLEGANREEYQKILDEVKKKFDPSVPTLAQTRYNVSPPTPSKRRYDSEQESPSRKKVKEEDGKVLEPGYLPHPYASIPYGVPGIMRHSAFRPWSPGLSSVTGHTSGDVRHELHLNGMMPFPVDRTGPFPQYIQTSRPLVLASRASDFSVPQPADAGVSSNVRLPGERKRSSDLERSDSKSSLKSPMREGANDKDKNNNHREQIFSPPASLPKVNLTRTRSFEKPIDRHGNRSISPPPRSSNVSEIIPRGRAQISPAPYSSSSQPTQSTNTQVNNIPEHEIARPISRSREAAATAMLELKTSGQYRSGPPPLLSLPISPPVSAPASEPSRKLPPTSNAQKSSQTLISLDRYHYKWIIGGQSYIVSTAGVQSLETLRHLVEAECGSESGRDRLMHEIVKMKSLHEEKLDIVMRVKRDLESELELLKASNCETQKQAAESRRLFREEIEKLRQEHARMTAELSKMVKNGNPNQGSIQEEDSGMENKEKDLQSLVLELRMKNEKLKLDLIDEKEKKQEATSKLEDNEFKRGRLPFLMESPLSRMVRGVGNIGRKVTADEEHKSPSSPRPSLSPNIKKSLSAQVPHLLASAATSISHCQLNGILPPTTASINGLPREQLISNDIESPKTVVVS